MRQIFIAVFLLLMAVAGYAQQVINGKVLVDSDTTVNLKELTVSSIRATSH